VGKKQIKKKLYGQCFFCGEKDYELLDAHRVVLGGPYIPENILVCCAGCHRKIHCNKIIVDRKYPSTKGTLVHYFIDGEEFWKEESIFNDCNHP
jgi:hypothetical protein